MANNNTKRQMNPSEIVTIVVVMAVLAAWSLYGFVGTQSASQSSLGSTILKDNQQLDVHQPFQTDTDFKKKPVLRTPKTPNETNHHQHRPPQPTAMNATNTPVETTAVAATTETVVVPKETTSTTENDSATSPSLLSQILYPNPENIVTYTTDEMEKVFAQHFFNGKMCSTMKGENFTDMDDYRSRHTLVNITFNCHALYKNSGLGTGNYISAFYGLRMAAQAMGMTDVSIQCDDAEETKKELLLPWVMGMFPAVPQNDQEEAEELPELPVACSDYKHIPVGYKWKDMRYEWRRMAIAMVGIPAPDHPAATWAEENLWKDHDEHRHGRNYMELVTPRKGETPLFPDTDLDDAMLHFRCGDIISSNHPSFGFMKFGSFSRHLSPDVKSIGIATQPFDMNAQMRKAEGGAWKQERCKKVVFAFVDHLQELFPQARVRIHNGVNETIAFTFARMIMANQTVVGITSFGVFPGVTTFGTGYIRKPDYIKAPNRWLLTSPLVERVDNVKLIEEPKMMAIQCRRKWNDDNGETVLEWFRNYTMPANF